MIAPRVTIIDTGVANTASVSAALRRSGADVSYARGADELRRSEYVVLPGVGSFAAGMHSLKEQGFVEALIERVRADQPTLAICLGLQVLCRSSEESPGCDGFGVIGADVVRLRARPLPHVGWNRVVPEPSTRVLREGRAYFANTFAILAPPADWSPAWAAHGESFVAAVERGAVLACQFHPELSGAWGQALLDRWLGVGEVLTC